MPLPTVETLPSSPTDSLSPSEIAYSLTIDDLTSFRYYLWQHAPDKLPTGTRWFLWTQTLYLGIVIPELILIAVGGLAVAVYFSVRGVADAAQREAGLPGLALALYIVVASLALIYGFWPRRVLWRLVAWIIRTLVHSSLRKRVPRETIKPEWQYRLALTAMGPKRVVEVFEKIDGIESHCLMTESAPWSVLGTIAVTDDHAFLIALDGVTAFIVPARAFPDTAAFAKFVEETRQLHRDSGSPRGSPITGIDEQQNDATGGATTAVRGTGIMVYMDRISDRGQMTNQGI